MRCLLTFLIGMTIGLPVVAGGWPREEGTAFVSLSSKLEYSNVTPNTLTHMIYAEYGLPRRLTLGLDAFHAPRWNTGQALLFLRVPLSPADARHKIATTISAGQREGSPHQPLLRGSLNWGLGLEKGWLAADFHVTHLLDTHDTEFKLEAIWGHRRHRLTYMLGLNAEYLLDGTTRVELAPALSWKLTDRVDLVFGLHAGLNSETDHAIRVGSWISF